MSGPVPAGWADLAAELDLWAEAGRTARLWWRDDDAVAATPQFRDLLHLAGAVPLALAVIPAFAHPELAAALAERPQIAVLQHGWQHVNRTAGGKKSEYPPGRAGDAAAAEIAAGRARLLALFGPRALPAFVPPWNRLGDDFLTVLPQYGIAALSGMAVPHRAALPSGLTAIDVHLDLVAWNGGRGFIGEDAALAKLVGLLRRRRYDGGERGPLGILTHHLIMDRATAAFVARLIALSRSHRALRWAAVADLL
jgi:peptidoglycan/xylan/chitin deacetylase (PgdA/CDA1 family)